MTCPRCQANIARGMRFCGRCGAPQPIVCPRCAATNPPDHKFCGHCAASLTELEELPVEPVLGGEGRPAADPAASSGELKRVTVLFCDIVDSTGLTERLGPEAMHELIGWFMDTALVEVRRYDGTAPQFAGDGFLALFGAPATHEDHVRRALLAALAIRDAIGANRDAPGDRKWPKLRLRIGIHTGLVVFGSVGGNLRMDPTVIGDAANIGARLQAAAEPGTILISEDTRRLAEGYARVERIGPLMLKGKDEPIDAYRLIGVSHRRSSPAARPFVDRTDELARLEDLVRPVAEGRGRTVGVVGEAGIGKSRILAELRTRLGASMNWVEGRCLSYGTAVPYHLVLDLLRGVCGIEESDPPEGVAEKLRRKLEQLGMAAARDAPPLLLLLGIEAPGKPPALPSPETLKARTFEIVRQLVIRTSQTRSLAAVLEDLHWIDKVSEEFLAFLVEAVAGAPILLIATYRPGYRLPWLDKSYAAQIPLQPLSRTDSLDLVRSVPGDRDQPTNEAIVAKADGNPLFLEELSLDAGEARGSAETATVPNTIQDVVMARIDRLPAETKRLLQTAAVIGREFSARLLRAVWRSAGPIEPHLSELVRLEFIRERADPLRPGYVFRHALTQETAYLSLLERHRRSMHARVGQAIESFYEGRADEVAERLALHFGRSDDTEKAVDYAILAAEKAQRRWANTEALSYFDDALRRLDTMPDTAPNRLRRIDAVLKQAEVYYALGQYRQHIEALANIRAIVEETGDPRRRATWQYWTGFLHSLTGGRPEIAIEHCQEAARIAAAAGLEEIDAFAASCLAQVYMVAGRQHEAIEAGERALASFEARGNLWWAGRTLWLLTAAANYLGKWDASLDYCRRGLDHGIALDDLRLKVVGWTRMGLAYILRGDFERGLKCCEEALSLSPIPRDTAWARVVRGYGKTRAGQMDDGIAELKEALSWFENSQMRWTHVLGAALLAEGHFRRGDLVSVRPLADYILTTSRATGYLQYEARACWLMAECLAAEEPAAARGYVEQAVQIFDRIGARNDLGKAMITQARLCLDADDPVTARRHLERAAEIFDALQTADELDRVNRALASLHQSPGTRASLSEHPTIQD
jgi:class 3 adenylate cyclase/tetratricopeptide (TPR) repeat protein